MTFIPQIIDNTAPGESLRSGAAKINTNFESIASTLGGTVAIVAGEPLSDKDLVWVAGDGKAYKAFCNGTATQADCCGIAMESITTSGFVKIMPGLIEDEMWSLTPGATLYVSNVAGIFTETPTSTEGEFLKPVGIAISATQIYFNPQTGWEI